MRYIYILVVLIFLMVNQTRVQSQTYVNEDIDLEAFIERLFSIQDVEINYDDLYESLYQFYLDPVDLNNTTPEELNALYILTDYQINSFFNYRKEFGQLVSIYELRAVPGFDLVTIRNLLPFVIIGELGRDQRPLLKRILTARNNFLLLRHERVLEESEGFQSEPIFDDDGNVIGEEPPAYKGNRDRYYARFRVQNKDDFSIGFTTEKDQGEQLIWDPNTNRFGMDYYSAHLMLENKFGFKKIIVGDYQMQFGQGILFNGGFGIGKGAEAVKTVRRSTLGLRPYTSVLEVDFLRGAAATYEYRGVEITGFYSNLGVDGNIQQDTSENDIDQFLTALQNTGLHRTESEIQAKRTIGSESYGANITYRNKTRKLLLGATFVQNNFSVPIIPQDFIRNRFRFSGDDNYNIGAFGEYYWKNFNLFGEGAMSESGGLAGIIGFTSTLSNEVQFAFMLRDYARDFHSFFGDPFAESSVPINERGIYWGVTIRPISRFTLNAFYDRYSFPWLRTGADAPSEGGEYRIRLTYEPSRKIMMFAETRGEKREINTDDDVPIRNLVTGNKRNYTFNLNFDVNEFVGLRSRVQFSNFTQEGTTTNGFAIIQDVNLKWKKFKLSNRFALVDTDDNENRQYFYERNVLWANTLFSLGGESALRWYSLFEYKLNRHFQFQTRIAQTNLRFAESLGSGNDEIAGNTRTQITSQVKIVF